MTSAFADDLIIQFQRITALPAAELALPVLALAISWVIS